MLLHRSRPLVAVDASTSRPLLIFYVRRDKSAAEKRRQLIQESKFLGGDMEHTHLVKGLDFALLQKVSLCLAAACVVLTARRRRLRMAG